MGWMRRSVLMPIVFGALGCVAHEAAHVTVRPPETPAPIGSAQGQRRSKVRQLAHVVPGDCAADVSDERMEFWNFYSTFRLPVGLVVTGRDPSSVVAEADETAPDQCGRIVLAEVVLQTEAPGATKPLEQHVREHLVRFGHAPAEEAIRPLRLATELEFIAAVVVDAEVDENEAIYVVVERRFDVVVLFHFETSQEDLPDLAPRFLASARSLLTIPPDERAEFDDRQGTNSSGPAATVTDD